MENKTYAPVQHFRVVFKASSPFEVDEIEMQVNSQNNVNKTDVDHSDVDDHKEDVDQTNVDHPDVDDHKEDKVSKII